MYDAVLTERGAVRGNLVEPGHRLLAMIMNRVLGLGTVIVDEGAWELLPEVVLRRPSRVDRMYTNWGRHTTTWFAQAGGLEHTDPTTRRPVKTAYLEHTLMDIGAIRCLNSRAPETDEFRTRLAGVDALATLAVWHHAPGDRDHPYMPWHRAYEAFRYEGAIVLVLTDQRLREVIFRDSDEHLAQLLLHLEDFGITQMARYGGGGRYVDPTIQRFVAEERDRRDRERLVESVIAHARAIGVALPLSRSGRGPTLVTYADGATIEFVGDFELYKRLMQSGEVDRRTARSGVPPRTIRQWSADELMTWLDSH
jgi:hypothetical protein